MPNSNRKKIISVLESMVASVQQNEEKINDLNVFPVPDGDTGSNMLATLLSAWNNISDASVTDYEVLRDFSRGALLGARGNSGVITSQIIRGFAKGVEQNGKFSWTTKELRQILRSVKEYAYKSVSNPVEGTILSVVRALDEKYEREADSIQSALKQIFEIATQATEETPLQLKVLQEAGVVDSGAFGLVRMIEGAFLAIQGKPFKLNKTNNKEDNFKFIKADPNENIGYCTEFILTLKDPENFDEEKFKSEIVEKLNGDSLVLVREEDILKVHIHVKKPGDAFNFAQKYGEFSKIKSENMTTQTKEAGHIIHDDSFSINKKLIDKELAIIAVSNGVGLDQEFKKAGVNYIIKGGQSMNPSVEDFIKIIKKLNYKNIVLLPNNSNIILTAETVKKITPEKNIFVVPTKSLQQGLVTLYNINKEMYDFHEYEDKIIELINDISEGQITIAIRNTKMNEVDVKKGDFISMRGKRILSSTKTIEESTKKLIDEIVADDCEVITIIYNDDVNENQIESLKKYIKSINDEIEIEIIYGAQSVYHLLIFGEK